MAVTSRVRAGAADGGGLRPSGEDDGGGGDQHVTEMHCGGAAVGSWFLAGELRG